MKRAAITIGSAAVALAAIVLIAGADTSPTSLDTRRLFGLWRARHVLAALLLIGVAAAAFARARSHDAFRTVVTAAVTVGLAFGTLEAAGRLGLVSWQAIFAPKFGDLGALGTKPVPNQDVKGASRKDTASVWGMPSEPIAFHYRTDRRGFRNLPDRQDGDIHLIGDSILVAALVPFEQTLVARLDTLLQRPVLQTALINTAPQTMIEHFEKSGFDLKGRLVLQFVFEGNDLVDSAALQPGTAALIASKLESRSFFDHAWRLLTTRSEPTLGIARTRSCTLGGSNYTFFWTAEHFAGYEGQAGVITQALGAFGQSLRQRGAAYGVVIVPTKLRVLAPLCPGWPAGSDLVDWRAHLSPLRDHVLAWGREQGVPVLDLTPALVAEAQRGAIPWFDADTHWNARGHEAGARAVAAWDLVQRHLAQGRR